MFLWLALAGKINSTTLIHENQDMCQLAQILDSRLKSKLDDCDKERSVEEATFYPLQKQKQLKNI